MTEKSNAPTISWITGNPLPPVTPVETREQIYKTEDRLLKALDEPSPVYPPKPADEGQDIPVDPAAEKSAFAELLQFLADNPEDDTDFDALSPDEFAEQTFTPPSDPGQE